MKIAQVRKHALSLEAVTEEPHHDYSSFRVRGKIFVTVPPGNERIHVFLPEDDRDRAVAICPEVTEKLLWAGKVVGLRIQLPNASPNFVKNLVTSAYAARVAKDAGPKRPRSHVNRA